jgi:transposase
MRPAAVKPPDEQRAIMDELAKRREQLIQIRTAELNRLKTAGYATREYIEELLKYIEQQLAKVEQHINATVRRALGGAQAADECAWSRPVTANILLIRLPEILKPSCRSAGWTRADGQPKRQ